MHEQTLPEKKVTLSVKNLIVTVLSILAFAFSAGTAYAVITGNTKDIESILPEVAKIPVLEAKLEQIVKGQDEIRKAIENLKK